MDCSELREGLFESFKELVEIEVCSSRTMVPENNKLLRCFQYIKMDRVSVGDYCWNGECANCQIWYQSEEGEIRSALACRLYVRPGMVITGLSANLTDDLTEQGENADQSLGLNTNR
ncbi:MAG TPA: hypothetical protein VLM38_24395 [Blastocatellia bacterium]|nr:hypothetical protein [Blastocatellia bacterium]